MGEISTNFSNAITNKAMVEGLDITEYADADEMIFYYALRSELELLKQKPRKQVIDNLLNYSKSIR